MSLKRKLSHDDYYNTKIVEVKSKKTCDLEAQLSLLQRKVKEKELKLQKLKIVEKYKQDEECNDLSSLIKVWSEICEKSLEDLYQVVRGSSNDHQDLSKISFLKLLGVSLDFVEVNNNVDNFQVIE